MDCPADDETLGNHACKELVGIEREGHAPSTSSSAAAKEPLRGWQHGRATRWKALCPEKSASADNLSVLRLGANEGTRCCLKDGIQIMLLAEIPPATTHEACDAALDLYSGGDSVAAARILRHASPLTVGALIRAHLEYSRIRLPNPVAAEDTRLLSERDLMRTQLCCGATLPVPFIVTNSSYREVIGQRFESGDAYCAFHSEGGLCVSPPILDTCRVVRGGWMDLSTAVADTGSRAAQCVVTLDLERPFEARVVPAPPIDDRYAYCKVHALGPSAHHHALLLALRRDQAPYDTAPRFLPAKCEQAWTPRLTTVQQLEYRANLVRRCIGRGRLFGGGAGALRTALRELLQDKVGGVAAAFSTVLLTILEAVRVYTTTENCLPFPALVAFTILASSSPSWIAPSVVVEALIATAIAAQAADTRKSRMHWRQWRLPSTEGADRCLQFGYGSEGGGNESILDAMRLLSCGFVPSHGEQLDMILKYSDVFLRRGGLPLSSLPQPGHALEQVIGKEYHLAALSSDVFPRLVLYLQAALPVPPRCNSGDLKDNNMRNLSFFVEQTLYNVRDLKEAKVRGGYIEQGDMERIVVYMDDKHYTDGADLASSRALGDDSMLHHANVEGFTHESECHMGSDRCRALRDALCAVQTFVLNGPGYDVHPKPRFLQSTTDFSPLAAALAIPEVDERAGLEGFLSIFGASLDVPPDMTRSSRPPLRVTCANLEDPLSPLVVQRSGPQDAENHDPHAVVTNQSDVRRATRAYCAEFPGTVPIALPQPPPGLCWSCGNVATVRVEPFFELDSTSHTSELLRFFIGDHQVPAFNATSVLRPCPRPKKSWDLGKARQLLRRTLYLEPCESQIMLLWKLREQAAEFRMGTTCRRLNTKTSLDPDKFMEDSVIPQWVQEAMQSPISAIVWQEVYARLLLEEAHDGELSLSLAHPHPYQGMLLRVVLLLQLLYFDVLIPTRDELTFHIKRNVPHLATRHTHLVASLQALAFGNEGNARPTGVKSSSSTAPGTVRARSTTQLYDYQVEAVSRLVRGRNSGLQGSLDASSLGAGKTLVALRFCLALAQAHGGGRFLVLVGSENLMDGWRMQIFEHLEGVVTLLQQENGVLRNVRKRETKSPTPRVRKADPTSPRGRRSDPGDEPQTGAAEFIISTYSRATRHPFSCTFLLVVADECLSLQNADSLQSAAAWRLVTRSLYGGHFISGTMFRRHYQDLLEMLKMLRSSLPLRAEYIQAYFRVHLIMYSRNARKWETRLEAMDIPESIRGQYLEVLDECRGRDAQNYAQVLGRMRRVLNDALRNGRLLAERIWAAVAALRADGYTPVVFSSTEYEAEALVRHIGCARRYRHDRHPRNCPGCDICRGFNKFMVGQEACSPICGSDNADAQPLTIFTVGADAQGLNLQSFGDALVLRPVQTDVLIQMMGRLDRPGQSSETLCRTIVFLRRTHEEAEVAHLQKYAAFWNLQIRPLARDIVQATVDASSKDGSVSECFERLVSGDPQAVAQARLTQTFANSHLVCEIPALQVRQFVQEMSVEGNNCVQPGKLDVKSETPQASIHQDDGKLQTHVKCEGEDWGRESLQSVRMTQETIRQGLNFLLQRDPPFQHILQLIGPPTDLLELLRGADVQDAFTTLTQSICHQQLSLKVCQQMFERLLDLCGNRSTKLLDPNRVLATAPEKIREYAQLSFRKISYIQHAARRFASGELSTRFFEEAADEEVRHALIALPGIGEWTAEMFLIFQLHRHGAYLYGDVAFQKAMKMAYNIQAPAHVTRYNEVNWMPTRAQMERRVKRWGPYSTIASLYLLRVADNERSAIFLPEDALTQSESESDNDILVKREAVKREQLPHSPANAKRRRKVDDVKANTCAEADKLPRDLPRFRMPLKKAARKFGQNLNCARDAVINLT